LKRANRDLAREKFWRNAIKRQIESGLSQNKFCEREKLSANTFSFWKRLIRKRDSEKETSGKGIFATGQPGVQPFIPVVVSETSQRIDTNQHQVVAQVRFACNLVSVFAGADIETLRALFSAYKEFLE
jgi:hypothetical protein